LGTENDGIENKSGADFEKLHTDAPPRANAQEHSYKMGLTGL